MKFLVENTKTKQTYTYSEEEVKRLFDCDTRSEHFISEEEYNYVIENAIDFFDEETLEADIAEYKKYCFETTKNVYKEEKDFCIALIEYETWTSPKGVMPVFEVKEFINE